MKHLKVMPVIGVRPQVVKAAPLIKLLNENRKIDLQLVHTGQHYDFQMSRVFFKDFNLPAPRTDLGVGSGTHAQQTAAMMIGIEKAILRYKPDVVIVFGDANTALAGALAAVKLHVPTAHVESGLRSGNLAMAEEVNRIVVDHCSDILFAPTKLAVRNLLNEGIDRTSIFHVGDTMADTLIQWRRPIEASGVLNRLGLKPEGYIVLTTHRAENVDDRSRLSEILSAVEATKTLTVFPVHPRTKKNLIDFGLWSKMKRSNNILAVDPLDYIDMLSLVKSSRLLLTDSGGMQKEAFLLKVPCLTLREETEWQETVDVGANRLVGTDQSRIVKEAGSVLANRDAKRRLARLRSPYGDGHASKRIVTALFRICG